MDNSKLVESYLGELADRAIRFYLHLAAVEREFYHQSPGYAEHDIPDDKPMFLDSFRACVFTVLETVARLSKECTQNMSDNQRDSLMDIARHAFVCINNLHETGLPHLPRPSEPVELRRFCRIIARHVLKDRGDIAVYITETTVDAAFAVDPITNLKTNQFARLVEMANGLIELQKLKLPEFETTEAIHVSIARIDSRNPMRWATLMHEAGHKLLTLNSIGGIPLLEQFNNWLTPPTKSAIDSLKINLEGWLTEVWCDLFAALVMGPAFFFSQFAAFVTAPPSTHQLSNDYPPHSFRLRMILALLRHRYTQMDALVLRELVRDCLELVEHWDKRMQVDILSAYNLTALFDAMRAFFQEHFFSGEASEAENFQQKFESMVRYVRAIEPDSVERMCGQLSAGLPIASKQRLGGIELAEEPTSVQEVLLAAWLHRLGHLREWTRVALQRKEDHSPWGRFLEEKMLQSIERFDDAVLRSLQVGEWLHLLMPDKPDAVIRKRVAISTLRAVPTPVMTDIEICSLLAIGEIRVMPIVDLEQQLGSTSLDLRLGTSFEVYLPACRRPAKGDERIEGAYDSRRIDLDYLEHVVLLPGQFMLAHSFEYLKLANWIGAELDGRSSYARLGLEVHMTAGMIEPGFEGVVTFELFNAGPNPIPLFPGLRIAQLRFCSVTEPERPYSKRRSVKYSGRLQHNTSLYMNDPDFKRIRYAIGKAGNLGKIEEGLTTKTEP